MPTFQTKRRLIHAQLYYGDTEQEGVCTCAENVPNLAPHVHTMHDGQMVTLKIGDWIVQEPDGEHYYPIADKVFQANYERIE